MYGVGYRVLGLGFGVWGFGIWLSVFVFWVLGFRFQVSGFRFQVSGSKLRVPGFGLGVWDPGFEEICLRKKRLVMTVSYFRLCTRFPPLNVLYGDLSFTEARLSIGFRVSEVRCETLSAPSTPGARAS